MSGIVFIKSEKIPAPGRDQQEEENLTAVAENPQQHQEQVDEIEIQR